MQDDARSKIKVGAAIDQILEVLTPLDEKSRRTAVRAVCEHLEIQLVPTQQEHRAERRTEATQKTSLTATPGARTVTDIRSFAQQKSPASNNERAVLVAYWLAELAPESERKESIEKEDLEKYFKQAGFPLPKRPDQTLVNAKNAGYLEALGEGRYRLNAVGHNLIVHGLPREPHQSLGKKPSAPRKRRGTCKSGTTKK